MGRSAKGEKSNLSHLWHVSKEILINTSTLGTPDCLQRKELYPLVPKLEKGSQLYTNKSKFWSLSPYIKKISVHFGIFFSVFPVQTICQK